ncbi:MAG TPA: flagellar hook-length control protein FliK [Clostridiales bacterium]|nr:flagellar hook-length control protein FliK [Clostridiales bacterium]
MTITSVNLMEIGSTNETKIFLQEPKLNISFDKAINDISLNKKEFDKKETKNNATVDNKSKHYRYQSNKPNQVKAPVKDNNYEQEEISETIVKIQDVIKKQLNITDEELASILLANSLTSIDLLDFNNISKIIMSHNELDDISEIFVNDDLSQSLISIINELNQTVDTDIKEMVLVDNSNIIINNQPDMKNEENNKYDNADKNKTTELNIFNNGSNGSNIEVLNEKDTNSQEQSKDFKSTDSSNDAMWNDVINNIVNNSDNKAFDVSNSLTETVEIADIINQIIEKIKIVIKPDISSMEMHLNPDNLGKVNITVVEKNGLMTAEFLVENYLTKEAIESQIGILFENINNQGLKVEAMEVTVANFEFQQNNTSNNENEENTKRNSNKKSKFDMNVDNVEGNSIDTGENSQNDGISGTKVNYMA